MKKVLYPFCNKPNTEEKKIELTHCLTSNEGWVRVKPNFNNFDSVSYLGVCTIDGEMFKIVNKDGHILIYKGHLNDGVY